MPSTKKKTFDAVAESRRWRRASSRQLRGLTYEQMQEVLRKSTEEFFAQKPARPLAKR